MAKIKKMYWEPAECRKFMINAEDSVWGQRVRPRLREGEPLKPSEWPKVPPLHTVDEKYNKVDDYPAVGDGYVVVSQIVRELWEAEAPGAAQYLPIRLEGPGVVKQYWAVNWLCLIDCLDEQSYDEDANGRFVQVPIIDANRIPDDQVLGAVKDFTPLRILRNDLRLKMIKAGITGVRFSKVAHADGTNFVPFIRPDYSKAKEEPKQPSADAPKLKIAKGSGPSTKQGARSAKSSAKSSTKRSQD
jgi:hypothetical protein